MPKSRFGHPATLGIFLAIHILSAQTGNQSLLKKPWIADTEAEEERSVHRLLQSSPKLAKEKLLQDRFGRNYRITPGLQINYVLDDSYKKEFPILEEGELAVRELLALKEARKEYEAIFLGKGIGLCQRILAQKIPNQNPPWAIEANAITNSLLKKYQDKKAILFEKTDPYGCYMKSGEEFLNLVLESEDFRYQVQIPFALRYEGLSTNSTRMRTEDSFLIWNLVRFGETAVEKNLSLEEEFLENRILQESGKKEKKTERILFSLGTTFDKSPGLFHNKDYFLFWDRIRGLQKSQMREIGFLRKKEGSDYLSTWTKTNEVGKSRQYFMKETYFYKSPLGYFLSLSYPEDEKERAELYWKEIRETFRSKEY